MDDLSHCYELLDERGEKWEKYPRGMIGVAKLLY